MIEPMVKIEIVGLLDILDDVLDFLQQIGTVQIDEIPTVEDHRHPHLRRIHLDEKKEYLLDKYKELSETVSEILDVIGDANIAEVPLNATIRDELQKLSPDELLKQITQVSKNVRRLARQRRNLVQDMESAEQYEHLIHSFLPFLEKAGPPGEMEQIGVVLKRRESSVLPVLKRRIEEITGPESFVFHQKMPDDNTGVFIVVAPEDLPQVREFLSNEGVAEYHIPREFRKKSFLESIETIRNRINEIPREIEKIDQKLLEIKKSHAALLRFIQTISTNRLNQLKILSRLVRTRYTFVVSGWTPSDSFDMLQQKLHERFCNQVHAGKVVINDLDFLHIPTHLTNRGIFRSSEILMKLLPPPKYGNLDATPFIAIFFPLFFGVILGDMAYGLILLVLAGIVKWKVSKDSIISDVGTVALAAGISTVIFGFIYGEFLGNFGSRFGIQPIAPWLHREGAIEVLLLLALCLGTLHVILGFILKIYVSILSRHVKGAIEGLAKIIVILGIIGIIAQLFIGFSEIVRYISYALLGFGLCGILFSEGFIGFLEIFSVLGNILSYSRIMAIGLASVILASVANRLAEASHNIIAAILIGTTIHLINFTMGLFSPAIHSLRLHYVEFFSKFFVASGKQFQPFKKVGEELT